MAKAIRDLTLGYETVHGKQEREYFGLRDFYSVVKMVFAVVAKEGREPTPQELCLVVRRNFGGYFGDFDPAEVFLQAIALEHEDDESEMSSKQLIMEAVASDRAESR